jgi:hypothetical protein
MKTAFTILAVFFVCSSQAQTWDEWFQQKKTQKKYLAQQIAALKVYSDYLKKGYNIARSGLNTVEQITDGNWQLDASFFDSHKDVNPSIKNSVKVANIIGYEAMTIRDFRKLYNWISSEGTFTTDEVLYIGHVFANLLRACDASLAELRSTVQSHDLEMTDDERLKRLDLLYQDAQDRYSFMKAFASDTRLLSAQRQKGFSEIKTIRQINN